MPYSFVSASSRFKIAEQTPVYAACSAGSSFSSRLDSPIASSFFAASGSAAYSRCSRSSAGDQDRPLLRGRLAGQDEPKRQLDPFFRGRAGGRQHALGHGAGGLDVGRVVQRRQGVQRRVGADLLHRADLPAGRVEELRRPDDPPPERVEAPAVERVAVVLLVLASSRTSPPPRSPLRLVRLDRRAADLVRPAARWRPAPGRGASTTAAGTAARGPAAGSPGRARPAPA